jgi:hypothetical protein
VNRGESGIGDGWEKDKKEREKMQGKTGGERLIMGVRGHVMGKLAIKLDGRKQNQEGEERPERKSWSPTTQ